jgi:hypothetical protein
MATREPSRLLMGQAQMGPRKGPLLMAHLLTGRLAWCTVARGGGSRSGGLSRPCSNPQAISPRWSFTPTLR